MPRAGDQIYGDKAYSKETNVVKQTSRSVGPRLTLPSPTCYIINPLLPFLIGIFHFIGHAITKIGEEVEEGDRV